VSNYDSIELTPVQASDWIQEELTQARRALSSDQLDSALDAYVRALGLALQLGPAPTEQALVAILDGARVLASRQDGEGLSSLGPALVGLTAQVREAGALPATAIMEAWADVVDGLGALTGQIGLAMKLPPERRQGMLASAQVRAQLLDETTDGLFDLTAWVKEIARTST
jgi:hypothetical protein